MDLATLSIEQLVDLKARVEAEIAARQQVPALEAAPVRNPRAELAEARKAMESVRDSLAAGKVDAWWDRPEFVAARDRVTALEKECESLPLEWAIDQGCVSQERINWSDNRRAKNWMATVKADRAARGGLARAFWDRGAAGWCKVPAGLAVGDVVEAAADYTKSNGKTAEDRRYYEVVAVAADKLTVRKAGNPAA